MRLVIGTYTEQLPHVNGQADGILTASFDPGSGLIGEVSTAVSARNPSYLAFSSDGQHLYAVSETESSGGQPGGGVAAYACDLDTGRLTLLNEAPSSGPSPCYVSLDRTGRFVLVANYGTEAGSVTVYEVAADGRLGSMTSHLPLHGSGPVPDRQAGPHAHSIVSDPVTGYVLVTDLGSDAVLAAHLDAGGGLATDDAARLAAPPGSGPRHLAFHPDGQHVFLVNELNSTVCMLRRDGGRLAYAGCVSTLPGAQEEPNLAAAVRVTPSGRHVLVTNRGHDSIAVYRFNPDGPVLSPAGHAAVPGAVPRDFIVTPDGRRVIVACQDSDLLASYPFDDDAGTLGEPVCVTAPTPVCVALWPAGD
jgi:6-phosphogluconolactonase